MRNATEDEVADVTSMWLLDTCARDSNSQRFSFYTPYFLAHSEIS
jgi:hypothetical protein